MTPEQFAERERRTQAIAQAIAQVMEPGEGFCIMTFDLNQSEDEGGGFTTYVSNANREDMVKMLRETAISIEFGRDQPPGKGLPVAPTN